MFLQPHIICAAGQFLLYSRMGVRIQNNDMSQYIEEYSLYGISFVSFISRVVAAVWYILIFAV
jgi:hypothetical protein